MQKLTPKQKKIVGDLVHERIDDCVSIIAFVDSLPRGWADSRIAAIAKVARREMPLLHDILDRLEID